MLSGMIEPDPPSERNEAPLLEEASTKELAERALGATKKLIHAEVGLAKDEIREQLKATLRSAVLGLVTFASLVLTLSMLLVAIVVANDAKTTTAIGLAGVLGVMSIVTAVFAYRVWPKTALGRTRRRFAREAEILGRGAL
jgi:uncharacterized membrane protein YqjE